MADGPVQGRCLGSVPRNCIKQAAEGYVYRSGLKGTSTAPSWDISASIEAMPSIGHVAATKQLQQLQVYCELVIEYMEGESLVIGKIIHSCVSLLGGV